MASVWEFSPFAPPSALGARTSHPRPPFTLNDHSQVRPGLPVCVARSCVIGMLPANDRVAMVTVPSGVGVLMADDANGRGLAVPPMPESPHRCMFKLVPFAVARNPIDVTGQFLNDPSLLDRRSSSPPSSSSRPPAFRPCPPAPPAKQPMRRRTSASPSSSRCSRRTSSTRAISGGCA